MGETTEPQFTMSLVCCTDTILNEINLGLNQKQIASTYGMALVSASRGVDVPDWGIINRAIIARWSGAGLERIKKMAWKLARGG